MVKHDWQRESLHFLVANQNCSYKLHVPLFESLSFILYFFSSVRIFFSPINYSTRRLSKGLHGSFKLFGFFSSIEPRLDYV